MKKVVIVGAGLVGSTAAYALMIDGAAKEIALVDVCKEKAEGHAMDLNHGTEFVPNVKIRSCDDYSVCKDADIIIICAGSARKPEQTRLDLINKNASILKQAINNIKHFNNNCILLIVSNPVDVLTYLAIKESGFPKNKVFGTGTMLDTARFKFLLSEQFNTNPSKVDALVLGEHGETAFLHLSAAKIDCKNIIDVKELFEAAKKSAAEVIQKKGATHYAIGLCIAKIIRTILEDKEEILPVSTVIEEYDVCLSMPCIINKTGIKEKVKIELSDSEKKELEHSANVLRKVIDDVTF